MKANFESLSMKESELIDDFFMRLNGLVTNIRVLGEEVSESYVVEKLLRSVPPKFLQITSTIEQFGDLDKMMVEEAAASLKAHEERLKGKTEANGSQLLRTKEEWIISESEDKKLLLTKEEWQRANRNDNETGGSQRRRGARDKSRNPKKQREQRQEVNITQVEDEETALLLAKCDKEEGDIMLLKEIQSKFSELNEGISGMVRFGDGSTVQIKGKESITLRCKNGEERILHEVYYIPSLCSNIISLGKMSERGNRVALKGDYLWVFERTRSLLEVKNLV
ncbi:uncharacterized protein LOC141666185 [Apium graveolens]|uniref:uncharacterized protein LOC141666185 n=1 Tax=Apium graveolens TaxID=4045 RepID=UPI003D7BE397